MSTEYKITGNFGQWGEIVSQKGDAEDEMKWASSCHPDHIFFLEEREVGTWYLTVPIPVPRPVRDQCV